MTNEAPAKKAPSKPVAGKANPRSLKAAKKTKPSKNEAAASGGKPVKPGEENIGSLGAVVIRNEFYRDGYRSLLKLVVLEAFIILGLIGVVFFVIHTNQPENRYFATTEDGRLVPMVPLNQPNLSTPALLSWVAQAATEVMTFGFNDYRRKLQQSSRNFTRKGWESFTKALNDSRYLEIVKVNQQVLTAVPGGAPVITRQGLDVFGRYYWQVEMPLVVTRQSGNQTRSDNFTISVRIVRVPRLESPNGIGIEQWLAFAGQ